MQSFSLKSGLEVCRDGRVWRFRTRTVNNCLQFSDDCGELWAPTEVEFYTLYEKRELVINPEQRHLGVVPQITNAERDLSTYPPDHADEACRRQQYLSALLDAEGKLPAKEELPKRIAEVSSAISDTKQPPSPETIYRWARPFRRSRNVARLVPQHCRKGRKPVITGDVEDLLLDVINDFYLKPERLPIMKVWFEFKERVETHNRNAAPSAAIVLPSRSSVYRYVERLDSYIVDIARKGKRVANSNCRVAATEMQVSQILDRWEIDHTLLDVLIVDSKTGKVIGRPYLTVVIDRKSRMVMSFLLHLAAPNTESVLRVIERAIRPKHEWLSRYPAVINTWLARGLPLRLFPDNAAEFHAGYVYYAFNDLGIELMYPRTRGPEMKGAVERFFRTLNIDLIHCLPGTTRSNVKDKGDYATKGAIDNMSTAVCLSGRSMHLSD